MEALKHLELYDERRWTTLDGITCRDCAYNRREGCANAVVVLDEMRSRGNDMSMPIFDFTPDPDRRADQCPGMWPGEDFLEEFGLTMRETPALAPVSSEQVAALERAMKMLDGMIAANGGEAA